METLDVLKHYGVLGMRWGRHKQREADYRKKLTAIGKNKSVNREDAARFKYRNQHVAVRIGKTAASVTAQMVVGEVLRVYLTGRPAALDKKSMEKRIIKIATTTATNVVINDTLAKSASKRYTDNGTKIRGTKNHLISKEKLMEIGIRTAMSLTPVARWAIATKASSVRAERARNEARCNQWGSRILAQKAGDVITLSSKDYKIY